MMNTEEIKKFVMFYERITKEMISKVPKISDITINLDKEHKFKKIIMHK